jgi:hypothetical protein
VNRRQYLSRAGAAIVASTSVAGCSGGGGGGETTTDDNDNSANGGDNGTEDGGTEDGGGQTVTVSGPADGAVASNAIEELRVVALESQASDVFSVTITLENTGDQRTSAMDYTYTLALFDSDGNELGTVVANKANLGAGMSAGQQGTVIATAQFYDGEPSDVARYELTIDCSDEEGEDRGVYCP